MHKNTMVIGIVLSLLAAFAAVSIISSDSVDATDAGVEYTTDDSRGIIKIYMDEIVPDGNYQVSVVNSVIPSGVTSTAGVLEDHIIIGNSAYFALSGEVSYKVMLVTSDGTEDIISGTFVAGMITFDGNDAVGEMDPVRAGGTYTLPACGFETPDGKEFAGWMVDGAREPLAAGDTVEITGNMTLTAVWEDSQPVETATVEFETIGEGTIGIEPEGSVTVDVDTPIVENDDGTLTIGEYKITATPDDGYEFEGWTYTGSTVAGDMTITAVFEETEPVGPTDIVVTVNSGVGGSVDKRSVTVSDGTTVIANGNVLLFSNGTNVTASASAPTDAYVYTFGSWTINEETMPEGEYFPVTEGMTITAEFVQETREYTVTITENEHVSALTVKDANGTAISNGDSVPYGTRLTVTFEVEDGYQVYGGNSYGITVTKDVTIAPVAVAEIDVSVVYGEHGTAALGSLVLSSDNTWTATVELDADSGYRAKVSFDPNGYYEYVIDSNGNLVVYGLTADLTVNVTFENVPVTDDDDEEYIPPVIVVRPDSGDDDTTTYIVAIAAAAVVAILAALILMQTRKS